MDHPRWACRLNGLPCNSNRSHVTVALVVVMTQVLSLALRSLRQPRVISEVLCGVILGPTLLGRIPHFSDTIFPADSIPFLTLTANIGLVLFLFLVSCHVLDFDHGLLHT